MRRLRYGGWMTAGVTVCGGAGALVPYSFTRFSATTATLLSLAALLAVTVFGVLLLASVWDDETPQVRYDPVLPRGDVMVVADAVQEQPLFSPSEIARLRAIAYDDQLAAGGLLK